MRLMKVLGVGLEASVYGGGLVRNLRCQCASFGSFQDSRPIDAAFETRRKIGADVLGVQVETSRGLRGSCSNPLSVRITLVV